MSTDIVADVAVVGTGPTGAAAVWRLVTAGVRVVCIERGSEVLRAAGAVAIEPTLLKAQAGFHLMGTARMGDDPETSVVDRFGRGHEVPNLCIADASTFVTASCLNPTSTAQALALRAADHIAGGG